MPHVFISYSKKNKDYARRLADYLLDHGFDVWIDDRIDYGENWQDAMFHAVVECAACVVVMTPEARKSRWVQREVAWADEREKPFFPVLLDGENWPVFVLTQYVDVRDGRVPDAAFVEELSEYVPRQIEQGSNVTQQADHELAAASTPTISPEAQRLLDIMLNPNVPPPDRAEAGRQLAEIGDPRRGVGLRPNGLPDIDWVEIPAGEFIYQRGERLTLPTFHIARYPITYRQFQAFIDADDGFRNPQWWEGLAADDGHKATPGEQAFKYGNHPRENVSWWDAVAFCRWLSGKLGYEITLPTEQQWEKAARGTDGRAYPWGNEYIPGYANIDETDRYGLGQKVGEYFVGQTTAAWTYPQGASPYGVIDMSGNVWEWCLNEYYNPENTGLGGSESRVVRGGSWSNRMDHTRASYRSDWLPDSRGGYYGFRVVVGSRPT